MATRTDLRVEFCAEPGHFADLAWPLLIADEANHTVLLSAVQAAQLAHANGEPRSEPWLSAVALDAQAARACAILSRNNWLVSLGSELALAAIGRALRERGGFAAIVGPQDAATGVARACGVRTQVHFRLPLFCLASDTAIAAVMTAGRLQVATTAQRALLLDWLHAFRDEANLPDPRERIAADLERQLRGQRLRLWLNESGEPACLIGGQTIAPSEARIGPVYTPPQWRGRGYAQAAVATLCSELRWQGAQTIFLFTDAANPTSNALYLRIGFRPAGQHLHLQVIADDC